MIFTTRRVREEKALGSPPVWKGIVKKAAPVVVRLGAFLAGMYGEWKARKAEEHAKSKRLRLLKKSAVVLVSVLLGLVLLAGTVKALVSLRILTIHSFLSVAGADLPVDENGFTNILILGAGDKSHEGIDLTDSIMVVSLDPRKTKSAVMLSLPRDLYLLETENMGRGRINELYRNYKIKIQYSAKLTPAIASQLSLKELATEVGRNLHMQIHHVMKVDFIAFVDAVNTLGGLDIQVPQTIVDTEYPGANYTYQTFEIHKGLQHIDGETALKYARSRHTTSDFDRSARQQQLLQAMGDKARAEGIMGSPGRISEFLKILTDHVETTMSFAEILGAAKLADRIDRSNMLSYNLNIETGIYSPFAVPGGFLYAPPRDQFEGASVLLPFSLPEFPVTWKQIQAFMQLVLQNRAVYLSKPQIQILNAGAKRGMGRTLGNELIRYGFDQIETDNASDDRKNPPKLPSSVVVARTEGDESTAQFFAALLHLPVGPLPAGIPPEKQGPVTIVVGTDYTYTPLQDLLPTTQQ